MISGMVDLHIHTKYSGDNNVYPEDIIKEAINTGLKVISFTDYNTVKYYLKKRIYHNSGKESYHSKNKENGNVTLSIISGVEIMCKNYWEILGYGFKTIDPIVKLLENWNNNLNNLINGIKFNKYSEILRIKVAINSYDESILGQFDLRADTYRKLENVFKTAEMYRPSFEEAINAIKQSGGFAFLAHPITVWDLVFKKDYPNMHKTLKQLKEAGLDGLEIYQPRMCKKGNEEEKFVSWIIERADELDFLISVGSEFHGSKTYSKWIEEHGSCINKITRDKLNWLEKIL